MLKNARNYRDDLTKLFNDTWYDPKYQYYFSGDYHYDLNFGDSDENSRAFVSVDAAGNIVGFISYAYYGTTNRASQFGAMSFKDDTFSKYLFGKDLVKAIDDIFMIYHMDSLTFEVVVGNPVERSYDRLVSKCGGTINAYYHKIAKVKGILCDSKGYEIMREDYVAHRPLLFAKEFSCHVDGFYKNQKEYDKMIFNHHKEAVKEDEKFISKQETEFKERINAMKEKAEETNAVKEDEKFISKQETEFKERINAMKEKAEETNKEYYQMYEVIGLEEDDISLADLIALPLYSFKDNRLLISLLKDSKVMFYERNVYDNQMIFTRLGQLEEVINRAADLNEDSNTTVTFKYMNETKQIHTSDFSMMVFMDNSSKETKLMWKMYSKFQKEMNYNMDRAEWERKGAAVPEGYTVFKYEGKRYAYKALGDGPWAAECASVGLMNILKSHFIRSGKMEKWGNWPGSSYGGAWTSNVDSYGHHVGLGSSGTHHYYYDGSYNARFAVITL